MTKTIGALFAGLGLLAMLLAPSGADTPRARAAVASRGDPIFTIAGLGGAGGRSAATIILDVDLTIGAGAGRIAGVTYALHGPIGSSVQQVTYTGSVGRESYTYTADRSDRAIVAVTTVATSGGAVPVAVAMRDYGAGAGLDTATGASDRGIATSLAISPSASRRRIDHR